MNRVGKTVAIAIFVLAILFFGFKGCLVTVWLSPDTPTTYAVRGADGRSLSLILLPKNEAILLYVEDKTGSIEAARVRMRGTYGTHYFWRLWHLEGPGATGGLFVYNLFPEGAEPVEMETTFLRRFHHGTSTPTLRAQGDRTNSVIVFSPSAVKFEGMWLQKESTSDELLHSLIAELSTD
jgi:hypothetical protein